MTHRDGLDGLTDVRGACVVAAFVLHLARP